MARPLRLLVTGGWYHIVNRGNRRERIFLDDVDRRRFLGLVAELPERFRIEVHAFVLMDNHYHLLVRMNEPCLSRAIQWLQLSYCVRFHWAHQTSGHLFQGRFKAMHLQTDANAAEVARYLHLNPVRVKGLGLGKAEQRRAKVAGIEDPGVALVSHRLRLLEEYPWSSWRVYGGGERPPGWLETEVIGQANGGRNRKERMAAVRQWTEAPVRQGHLESPWERLVGGIILGDVEYAKGLLAGIRTDPEEQTEVRRLSREGRLSWEKLVERAEKLSGLRWEELVERYGDSTRDAVMYVAVRHGGYRLSEVRGKVPGLKYQAAAQGLKRFVARLETDRKCRTLVKALRGN